MMQHILYNKIILILTPFHFQNLNIALAFQMLISHYYVHHDFYMPEANKYIYLSSVLLIYDLPLIIHLVFLFPFQSSLHQKKIQVLPYYLTLFQLQYSFSNNNSYIFFHFHMDTYHFSLFSYLRSPSILLILYLHRYF